MSIEILNILLHHIQGVTLDWPGDLIGSNLEDQYENIMQFVIDMIGESDWTESDWFVGFEIFKRMSQIYNPDLNLKILTYLIQREEKDDKKISLLVTVYKDCVASWNEWNKATDFLDSHAD